MSPDFTIITPSIQLKLIPLSEAEIFTLGIKQSPSLHQWLDWTDSDFTMTDGQEFLTATRLSWIKAQAYGFGIYQRQTEQLVGMVAINEFSPTFNQASIGYWIFDRFQRQGFALKGVDALIEFAFDKLLLTRLELVCDPNNVSSQRFAERCGATFEAKARNRFIYNGKPKEGLVYSIIPDDKK
ncbi:GNAT family N-acetyltransferase [Vibrio maerlii]|uniref:GNAT family N-acetyltransferase n=1 Tax=Vibrio maerlii TaxID=2231648 RepID=UPI000E3BE5CA|nr:GNAT family protein [Vibrio maerlii]